MQDAGIAIVADSASDIPQELVERHRISVLPLKVVYGDRAYVDGVEISPQEVYSRFPKEIPTTSAPNVQEALDLLRRLQRQGVRRVIGVCVSSRISASYSALSTALAECRDLEGYVLDSKGISLSSGLCALWAAEKLESGVPYEEVVAGLAGKAAHASPYFYMDSMEYLVKGGRISAAAGMVGSLLGIKPIITCSSEGTYVVAAKPRGTRKSLGKLLELVVERAGSGPAWLALESGAGDPEQLAWMRRELHSRLPKATLLIEKQITATMAVHTGPGLIGVSVLNEL